MFRWEKSVKALDAPAGAVLRLFRSMRDVQLALPGLPPQEASAYLCQYAAPPGVGTAVVFHLHKSGQLAFYFETPRVVELEQAEALLDQALVFVESMGFLLTDLDIHLLGETDLEMLWSALPLRDGVKAGGQATPAAPALARLQPPVATPPAKAPAPQVPPGTARANTQRGAAEIDELLAAVAELRTRRGGIQPCRLPPTPEELQRRRQELRASLGRILASL